MKVINKNNLPTAPISEFSATQGDLKFLSEENYKKLKTNIERRGFYIPIYAWIDKKGQKWLLDGHQRKHVLETEGWNNPIPYLIIPADDISDAAERLLEITSQFGTITQEGIDEFIASFELPEVDVLNHTNFDGIFNFSIEPEQEEEPELEIEPDVEDLSIRFEVRYLDGQYRAKTTQKRKAHDIGTFDTVEELKEAVLGAIDEWEATPRVED